MAIPYNSVASQPQGLESVTINAIAYICDAVSMPSMQNDLIERQDALGGRGDFMLREGSAHITGSMTLQRALTTTVLPPEGTEFTYDFDRSGTASTLVVQNVTVDRSKDSFDTFSIDVVLVTYQA